MGSNSFMYLEDLSNHYSKDVDLVVPTSPSGKLHYEAKLSYLSDRKVIRQTWSNIWHYLKLHSFDIRGKSVLDLGCGTGFTSIYFASAGAREVVGVDLRQSKIEAFETYVSCLPQEIRSKVKVVKSSSEDLVYDDHFDLIYAQESISHIVDGELFERLFRMLKKGGVLYISDGNNELCGRYRKMIHNFWNRLENGPAGKCKPHDVEFVYREEREKLIREWYSDVIDDRVVERLVDNTAYLYGENLKSVCDEFMTNGRFPNSRYVYATPPIHPKFGYYNEKLFNPYDLKKKLKRVGFRKCSLHGPIGMGRGLVARSVIRMLPLRLKYMLSPTFIVIANK